MLSLLPVSLPVLAFLLAPPEFEAASLKRILDPKPMTIPTARGGPGTRSPERIRYSHVSMMTLLTKAYGVYSDQVFGPRWLTSEKYVLDAVLPPRTTQAQFESMLQSLLVERCKLAVERGEKEYTVYSLVTAKDGPKLTPTAAKPEEIDPDDEPAAPDPNFKMDANGCPVLEKGRQAVGKAGPQGECMTYCAHSMADFVGKLEMMVAFETGSYFGPQSAKAHIVDRTGLTGRYDFTLKYNAGAYFDSQFAGQLPPGRRENFVLGPSIFSAIEKQLGLRLEKSKARLGTIVIQHIERTPIDH